MVLIDTATFQVIFIVSLFCVWDITTACGDQHDMCRSPKNSIYYLLIIFRILCRSLKNRNKDSRHTIQKVDSIKTSEYCYAALLPRRGPHIASHSVCPSVRLSVRPVNGSSFLIGQCQPCGRVVSFVLFTSAGRILYGRSATQACLIHV